MRERPPARVLIVEDHALVREGLRELVNRQPDLRVCGEAPDAASALAQLRALAPDLVMLDLSLKDEGGFELLRRLRTAAPDVRVLVVSMFDENQFAERALRAGANGYVMKSESSEVLLAAVRRAMEGRLAVSPAVADRLMRTAAGGAPARPRNNLEGLSDRELEVLCLVGEGKTGEMIARVLGISPKTVETHRMRMKEKLGIRHSGAFVAFASRWLQQARQVSDAAAPAAPEATPRTTEGERPASPSRPPRGRSKRAGP